MGKPSHFIVGLLAAAAVAGLAATASAQADRDAAIHKCVQTARAEFPGSGALDTSQDQNRTFAYKACMTTAGFAP
jgi:hypothetical protein